MVAEKSVPEDYDTLRRLDKTVQPKTVPRQQLERLCPAWTLGSGKSADASSRRMTRAMKSSAACVLAEDVCCICLEPFAAVESLRQLPCGHHYHVACIVRSLSP